MQKDDLLQLDKFEDPDTSLTALETELFKSSLSNSVSDSALHMGSRPGEGVKGSSSDSFACSVFGLPSKANSKNANGGRGLCDVVYPLCCSKTVHAFLILLYSWKFQGVFFKDLTRG